MLLLKASAAVLVLFTSRTLVAEYKKYIEKKLCAMEGFLSLLSFIKNELACRLRTSEEWAREFSSDILTECGFLPELLRTGSTEAAFARAKGELPMLGEETVKLLSSYFSAFGKSYRDEEQREACRVFDELSRLLARERSDTQRSLKAVRILTYAVALGVIILFL